MSSENGDAVIGMSPGNSYFTPENIKRLLVQSSKDYKRVFILIPDIPAIATYEALGYPTNRARRDKAIPKGNNLRNKTVQVIEDLGLPADRVEILSWENAIQNNQDFMEKREEIEQLYKNNSKFREEALQTTKNVIEQHSESKNLSVDEASLHGVKYLLDELAFMLSSPKMLNSEHLTYVYHTPWPIYENLIAGAFGTEPNPQLGFQIIS